MFIVQKEAFWIGQYPVHWYGLIMAISVLIAIILASREERRIGLPRDTIIDFALIGVPLAMVFARAYYVAFEWEGFAGNPARIFAIWEGGIAMYGSLIGGFLAAYIIKKWRKVSIAKLTDAVAPGLILAQAIGRWGNFTNQEAFGPQVTDAWARFFPLSVYIERTGQWHMATFFYESMWCLAVFLVLWLHIRKKPRGAGDVFCFYVLLYGAGRALIEGLRTDSLYIGAVRVSQLGSVILMLGVCIYFLIRRAKAGAASGKHNAIACAAILLAVVGVTGQNALITDLEWLNWLLSFVCSFGLIACGFALWWNPVVDDYENSGMQILSAVDFDGSEEYAERQAGNN